jgi:hypothetical protein
MMEENMKRIYIILSMVFLSGVILSQTVYAFPFLTVNVGAAIPTPQSTFSNSAKTGLGGTADVFFGLPITPIKIGGHFSYDKFDEKGPGSNKFTIIEVLPSMRYALLWLGVAEVYGQIGAGYYHLSSDQSSFGTQKKLGFNVGAGVSAKVSPSISIYVMPQYNLILTDVENTKYLTMNLGLQF